MITDLLLIVENVDFNEFEYEIIHEQINDKKYPKLKIKGPYAVAEKRNGNGRIYPYKKLKESIDEYNKDLIQTKNAFGELNHPPYTYVDYNKACHMVTKLEECKDGKTWIGESIVLTSSNDGMIKGTPTGDILASIIQHGGKPGISSRGVGKLGKDKIVEEVKIIAFDCVSNPSAPGAFVEGILEGKKFMIDTHGMIVEQLEQNYEKFEEKINNLPKKSEERQKQIVEAISNFINSLKI